MSPATAAACSSAPVSAAVSAAVVLPRGASAAVSAAVLLPRAASSTSALSQSSGMAASVGMVRSSVRSDVTPLFSSASSADFRPGN